MKLPHLRQQIIVLIFLVTMITSMPICSALTEDEVRNDLINAYEAVAKAEAAGGNVHDLVLMLDDVARTIPGASEQKLEEAKTLVDLVLVQAPEAEIQGDQRITTRFYVTAFALIIIASLGVMTWMRGSRWLWGAWLWAHRGWRVERV